MRLTEPLLRALCPRPRSDVAKQKAWDGYVAALSSEEAAKLFDRYEVTTPLRMAHVLANWAHETGGFTIIWESGAYSAQRITEIFGVGRHSASVTPAEAARLAYNGPALFDRVYGLGNPRKAAELGNDRPGDGWTYRGCGIVQITGKRDHFRYAAMVGCKVEELQKPLNSIHAALCEWEAKGCGRWADQDDTVKVRRLINGGRNGLADVRQYLAKVKPLLARQWPAPPEEIVPKDNILRLGSEGALVYWVQQQLMIHGYYVGNLDSVFSGETEKQLMGWQKAHGFTPTGEFDPDDKEMRDALALVPARVDRPKRDVTADDLIERGSKTVETTSWWKKLLRWVFGANAAVVADQASGFGLVDAAVTQGEQVKGLVDRTTGLVKYVPDTRVFVMLGVAVAAYLLYRAFDIVEKRRVADAQSGRNMGR